MGLIISSVICISLLAGVIVFLTLAYFDTVAALNDTRKVLTDAQDLNSELTDALDALGDYTDKIEAKMVNQARQIEGMNDVKKAKTITLTFPSNEAREAFFEYMDSTNFVKEWIRVYSHDIKDNFESLLGADYLAPKAIIFTKGGEDTSADDNSNVS